jgi:hypothetical protein
MRLPSDELTAMCSHFVPTTASLYSGRRAADRRADDLQAHHPDPECHVDGSDAGNVLLDGKRAS